MATSQRGGVRRATPNTVTAMTRSANNRRCPACGRGSAIRRESDDFGSGGHCRWDDCEYAYWLDRETGKTTTRGLPEPGLTERDTQ